MSLAHISVIIPCSRPEIVLRTLNAFAEIASEGSFEVIVVGDVVGINYATDRFPFKLVECLESHANIRRNIGLEYASGAVIAFLDDDAYPRKGWLKEASSINPDDNVVLTGPEAPHDPGIKAQTIYAVNTSVAVSGTKSHVNQNREGVAWFQVPFCNFVLPKRLIEIAGTPSEDIPWDMDDFEFCLRLKESACFFNSPQLAIIHDRYPDSYLKHLFYRLKLRIRTGEKVVSHPEIYAIITPVLIAAMLPLLLTYSLLLDIGQAKVFFYMLGGVYSFGLILHTPRAVRSVGFKQLLPFIFLVIAQHFLTIIGVAIGLFKGIIQFGINPLKKFIKEKYTAAPFISVCCSAVLALFASWSLGHFASPVLPASIKVVTHELFELMMLLVGGGLIFAKPRLNCKNYSTRMFLRILMAGVVMLCGLTILSHHPGSHSLFSHWSNLATLAGHSLFPVEMFILVASTSIFSSTFSNKIYHRIVVQLAGLCLALSAVLAMFVVH